MMTPAGAEHAASPGRPFFAYVVAALVGLAALYLLIRLLEWDRMNRETPNQDDPLFGSREEPENHD